MGIIDLNNVSYQVGNKKILDNVSLSIKEGSFTAIMGMNGSAKTSLLKLICRANQATSGEIYLKAKDINTYKVRDLAKQMSVVFQNDDIGFDFTCFEIVLMGRMVYQKLFQTDTEKDLIEAQNSMRQTNTLHLKDRMFSTLSGGEKQRVFIARAICQNTPIILLDEPVSSLDLKHQLDILNLLKQIQLTQGRTIIIVLHDLSSALKYADNVIALKEGSLFMYDQAKRVLNQKNIKTIFDIDCQIINNNNVILN